MLQFPHARLESFDICLARDNRSISGPPTSDPDQPALVLGDLGEYLGKVRAEVRNLIFGALFGHDISLYK